MNTAVTGKYILRPLTSMRRPPRAAFVPVACTLVSVAIVGWPPLLYVDPAGGVVVLGDKLQWRKLFVALVDAVGAARIERAAGRQVAQVGWQALDGDELLVGGLVEAWDRVQQAERV